MFHLIVVTVKEYKKRMERLFYDQHWMPEDGDLFCETEIMASNLYSNINDSVLSVENHCAQNESKSNDSSPLLFEDNEEEGACKLSSSETFFEEVEFVHSMDSLGTSKNLLEKMDTDASLNVKVGKLNFEGELISCNS